MFERFRRHALSLLLVSLALLLLVRGVIPAARASRASAAERAAAERDQAAKAAELAGTELWIQGLEEGDTALTARVRASLERSPDLPGVEVMEPPPPPPRDEQDSSR